MATPAYTDDELVDLPTGQGDEELVDLEPSSPYTLSRENVAKVHQMLGPRMEVPYETPYQKAARAGGRAIRNQGGPLVKAMYEAFVPQNEAELGGMLGVGGGAKAAAKLGLQGFKSVLARVGGGMAGGEIGGQIAGLPTGVGGGTAGLAAMIPEGLRGSGEWAFRRLPPIKNLYNTQQAKKIGSTLNARTPIIPAANTPADLDQVARDIAQGKGPALDLYNSMMKNLDTRLQGQTLSPPSLATGAKTQYTLPEILEELTGVGQSGFGGAKGDKATREVTGRLARDQYGTLRQETMTELDRIDPSGKLSKLFDKSRGDLSAALAAVKMFKKSNPFARSATQVKLDIPRLQEYVQKYQTDLQDRLGKETFEELQNILWRGGGMGTRDAAIMGSQQAVRPGTMGMTTRGSGQIFGSPLRALIPSFSKQYAGKQPWAVPNSVAAFMDMVPQAGFGSVNRPREEMSLLYDAIRRHQGE